MSTIDQDNSTETRYYLELQYYEVKESYPLPSVSLKWFVVHTYKVGWLQWRNAGDLNANWRHRLRRLTNEEMVEFEVQVALGTIPDYSSLRTSFKDMVGIREEIRLYVIAGTL